MHRESKKKRKFLFNAFLCLNFYSFCNINDIYNGSIHRRVKHKAVINRNNDRSNKLTGREKQPNMYFQDIFFH